MDFSEEMFRSILPRDVPDENPIETIISGINTLLVAARSPRIEIKEMIGDRYVLGIEGNDEVTPAATQDEVFIWLNGFASGLLAERRGARARGEK